MVIGLVVAAPASAQTVAVAIRDRPTVTLDPTQAYIMYSGPGQTPLMLMREPSAEDRANWQSRREVALAEAQRRYTRDFERWQRARDEYRAGERSTRVPTRPVEPTQDNFVFPAIETEMFYQIGPQNRFSKEGRSVYLSALPPGDYRIYGQMIAAQGQAVSGGCLCMGSTRFSIAAGVITNLGRTENFQQNDAIDPRLAAFTVQPAHFSAAGKLPNYFGVLIGRAAEIPGVLRYERDRVIDVATGADVTGVPFAFAVPPAPANAASVEAPPAEAAVAAPTGETPPAPAPATDTPVTEPVTP
ncbi:MAG: hypothetical protein ABL874_09290 [Sphingopyxis sp.]